MTGRLGPNDRIPRESWERPVDKQVDLVIYKGGERIVIGKAIVKADGSIEAQIAKDVRKEVKDLVKSGIGDISLNPPVRTEYNNVRVVDPTIKIDYSDDPAMTGRVTHPKITGAQ